MYLPHGQLLWLSDCHLRLAEGAWHLWIVRDHEMHDVQEDGSMTLWRTILSLCLKVRSLGPQEGLRVLHRQDLQGFPVAPRMSDSEAKKG